jgi:3-oxoacyl-(acyl-carrier-protein) synthase
LAFDVIGALTEQNHRPDRASRPFDAERDGFVLERVRVSRAGGVGTALSRGVPITPRSPACIAVEWLPHDRSAGGRRGAGRVHSAHDEDAALEAVEIDHINAHGSSTPQNDLCETNAVKRALGSHARRITMSSLKSMVGHALGASNAIEVAACALVLARQFLLPTINLDQPGEGCDLDYVANEDRPARIRSVLKLSSGFSGIHSALAMAAL